MYFYDIVCSCWWHYIYVARIPGFTIFYIFDGTANYNFVKIFFRAEGNIKMDQVLYTFLKLYFVIRSMFRFRKNNQ